MTSSITDISENANKSVSRLDMGSAKYPCDGNIKPIYPVRYAYVNFFGSDLEKPEAPPDIHTLMSATTLKESKGYAARLMRPGWIYIREEDSMEHRPSKTAYFHIFKYEPNGENQTEKFRKFIYRNKKDARDGVMPESGLNGEGYPFLFVAKDVSNISIAYSEHLWHPDVIARINGDLELRKKTMQFINLDDDNQPHAIEANEANFTKLIQDYKTRKEQFAAAKAKIDAKNFGDLDLASLRIDELTTQLSYEMDADKIALEIRSKLCYQEKSRIVILHDPVGRQKEILEAHRILTAWQQYSAKLNAYPLTIGMYVECLIKSRMPPAEYLKVVGAINRKDVNEHWPLIKKEYKEFERRQETFSNIFKAFASEKSVTAQVGSLDNYFKYFFSVHNDKEMIQEIDIQEIDTFVDLITDIFDDLQHPTVSEKMLEELISQSVINAETEEIITTLSNNLPPTKKYEESKSKASVSTAFDTHQLQYSTNTWEIAATGVVKIITHSYTKDATTDLSEIMKRVSNKFLSVFGRILGKAMALVETGAVAIKGSLTHLSNAAIQFISHKIVPVLLKPFSFSIDYRQGIPLTHQEFGYIIERLGKIAGDTENKDKKRKKSNKSKKDKKGNKINKGKKDPKMPKYHHAFKKLRQLESIFLAKQQSLLISNAERSLENAVKKVGNTIKEVGSLAKPIATQASINIKLGVITSIDNSLNFFTVGAKKTSILLDKTAPGVSLLLNVKTATSVIIQSKFDQNNPLDQHKYSAAYDALKLAIALISLTADIVSVTEKVTEQASKLLPKATPALLDKLDKITTTAGDIGKHAVTKTVLGLVSIVGAFVSFIDGQKAGATGNIGAQYSHYAMGLGGIALGITNIFSVASALLLTLNVIGWLLIIGGTIGLMFFNKSAMENIIYNCFWGKGNKYPFWNLETRPDMDSQLKTARDMNDDTWRAFNIERQEFLNILFMPQLSINRILKQKSFNTYINTYAFTLPGFQEGSSDLQYAFYKPLTEPVNNWVTGSYAPTGKIKEHMDSLIQKRIHYEALKETAEEINGKYYLYDEEMTAKFRKALQTASSEIKDGTRYLTITFDDQHPYNYQEKAEIFWHYIPFEDTKVPLRYLAGQTLQEVATVGFKGQEIL
ncbi:hypothetical protein AB204_11340 [Xenorhabdus khoisanae]|uniref:Toxin VasX N-terminal region domain-containing protein n=1 Tax=Xenorhabdus khoisanae TaxID=880157 RepID=A0A0J5FSF8_9GAMM|nr:toxin VasX [Xenorhabdus khoisanae]KMJ45004.1 hypothetical protein AB204_11340 [Xenorhabdus khoisanae]